MTGSILWNCLWPLLNLLSFTEAARILAVFPVPVYSHFSCNDAIMKSLHAAGHHVTFISPFPSQNQVENYTMINTYSGSTNIYASSAPVDRASEMSLSVLFHDTIDLDETLCYDVMKLKVIQEVVHSTEKLYDVMFIELLATYECYLPIAQKLGIPVIGTVTHRSWRFADAAIGFSDNLAAIPNELSDAQSKMTFTQRLRNIGTHLFSEYFLHYVIPARVNQFYQTYFPDFKSQDKKISMAFYNSHASVLPRPTTPNVVEVGGIHIQAAKPLPQNLQRFIDEAEAGVIIFSFGSIINASSMSVKARTAFVNAFAVIPQRVIWKFEEPIEDISSNVFLSNWIPQRDILGHKNVIAFISHCGLGGTYEAIHTGTPVITVPFFADQPSNAAILEELGVGLRLDIRTVTANKVLEILNSIISDTRYYERMQNLSRVFKDRPMIPQQSVVFWTEYVIRHSGAAHLQTVGSEMSSYKYFLVDIMYLVIAVVTAMAYMMLNLFKKKLRVLL